MHPPVCVKYEAVQAASTIFQHSIEPNRESNSVYPDLVAPCLKQRTTEPVHKKCALKQKHITHAEQT